MHNKLFRLLCWACCVAIIFLEFVSTATLSGPPSGSVYVNVHKLTDETDIQLANAINALAARVTSLHNDAERDKGAIQSNVYFSVARTTPYFHRQCADDWTRFQESCYLFPKVSRSWDESKTACVSSHQGADLVVIDSEEENNFVKGVVAKNKKCAWIGLRNEATSEKKSKFRWVNGKYLESTFNKFWEKDEPSFNGPCAYYWFDKTNKWDDYPCDYAQFFVCEYPIAVLDWKLNEGNLPFDKEWVQSEDQPFNLNTGEFTAPITGIYQFKWMAARNGTNEKVSVNLYKGSEIVAFSASTNPQQPTGTDYEISGNQAMLLVCKGEKVFLRSKGHIFSGSHYDTSFSGHLLSAGPGTMKNCSMNSV